MFWMMIVARGVAGFGAGGEYPVCGTSATEAADETLQLRKRRGILVATTADFAIDLVYGKPKLMQGIDIINHHTGICRRGTGRSHRAGRIQPPKLRRSMAGLFWPWVCGQSTLFNQKKPSGLC